MSEKITLFRRRFIPNELTLLKDDELLAYSDDKIITRWRSLKPRPDFYGGTSTYYRKKGIKVSKIIDNEGQFLHWYCDLVIECGPEALDVPSQCVLKNGATDYVLKGVAPNEKALVFVDMLADVIVNPNGLIEVADLDELADACEMGYITEEQMIETLKKTQDYLKTLYSRVGKIDYSDERFITP